MIGNINLIILSMISMIFVINNFFKNIKNNKIEKLDRRNTLPFSVFFIMISLCLDYFISHFIPYMF